MKVIKLTMSSGAEWLCHCPDDTTDSVVAAQLVDVPEKEHIEYTMMALCE